MYKPAVDERNRLQEKLRKKDNSEIEQRQLQAGMNRVAEALERAGDLRREVLQMLVDKEMPRITSIAQGKYSFNPCGQRRPGLALEGLSEVFVDGVEVDIFDRFGVFVLAV
jgi:hypothetical protein